MAIDGRPFVAQRIIYAVNRALRFLLTCLLLGTPWLGKAASLDDYIRQTASLIDPAKLATLRERGANPRVYKYVALLAEARQERIEPKKVAGRAVAMAGMRGEAAKLTAKAMLRNLVIADRLGCLDVNGVQEMRQGKAPTIHRGPYSHEKLSVDHIIPRAVVPELDKVIANLELMPLRANEGKNAKVGSRQLDLGRKLEKAGLLTPSGLRALEQAKRRNGNHSLRKAFYDTRRNVQTADRIHEF